MDEQRGAYEDAARRVDCSERAGAVSGFVEAVHSANRMREAAESAIVELRAPLALVLDDDAGAELVRSTVDRVAGQSDMLPQVVARASEAERLARESGLHDQAARAEDEASMAFARQCAETEALQRGAEKARDAGRDAVAEIPTIETRITRLTRIHKLLGDQERSTAELKVLQRRADCADRQSLEARERLVDLRERRLLGMAAELANGLDAGSPCPACGSCAHPTPATTTDAVSPEDIQLGEAEVADAAEDVSMVRSTIAAELAGSRARAAELAAQGPTMVATHVPEALVVATASIAHARAAAAALPAALAQMVALAHDVELLRGLVAHAVAAKGLSQALATSTREQSQLAVAEVASLLAVHLQSCPCLASHPNQMGNPNQMGGPDEMVGPDPTGVTDAAAVASVFSHHRQTLAQLRLLAAGLQELATHRSTVHGIGLRLSTALRDNGFETIEQAQDGVLPSPAAAELTALLRSAEEQRAQATALLAQPDVAAAVRAPTPDVDALAQAHTQAAASLTDAGRRHALSEQGQRDLGALANTVRQAVADLGPAEEEARLVQDLADCVAGNSADNTLRMRLSSYVLSARLVEIAILANERLATISDGRYTLEYTDARAARGARSGLGLLVRDAWTGSSRETSSLSGGEAFMASLALALGLGDAVRAEVGGFDLQTLFVDEGFGSLDDESLEQVMVVLDTLREGGRAVGIVSHVTELRARIPHQLQVIKAQAGSSVWVSADATSAA